MCFSKQIDASESLLDASLSSSICSASFDCSRAENSYKDTDKELVVVEFTCKRGEWDLQ